MYTNAEFYIDTYTGIHLNNSIRVYEMLSVSIHTYTVVYLYTIFTYHTPNICHMLQHTVVYNTLTIHYTV